MNLLCANDGKDYDNVSTIHSINREISADRGISEITGQIDPISRKGKINEQDKGVSTTRSIHRELSVDGGTG